jgi:hypothetical protein
MEARTQCMRSLEVKFLLEEVIHQTIADEEDSGCWEFSQGDCRYLIPQYHLASEKDGGHLLRSRSGMATIRQIAVPLIGDCHHNATTQSGTCSALADACRAVSSASLAVTAACSLLIVAC